MSHTPEDSLFVERDGDVIVDPEAMLPPTTEIPPAGVARMNEEELNYTHPEFGSTNPKPVVELGEQANVMPKETTMWVGGVLVTRLSLNGLQRDVPVSERGHGQKLIFEREQLMQGNGVPIRPSRN